MRAITLGAAFLLLGCSTLPPPADLGTSSSRLSHSPVNAARAGLAAQIAAWNRGDLEGALSAYLPSPEMTWVTKSGVQRGFAEFAQGMRTDFSKPADMGTYSAEVLDARNLGDGAVLVFRWQIVRSGKRLMGGTSTQIWQEVQGSWRAVLEHAS